MIISCPVCSARFELDQSLLGGGRTLRCGKCAHQWRQGPSIEEVPPSPTPESVDIVPPPPVAGPRPGLKADSERPGRPPAAPVARREPRPEPSGGSVAWIILLLLVAVAALSVWRWESEIIAAVPQTERLYQLVGLGHPAPGEGLEVENISTEKHFVDGKRELLVTGEVVNVAQRVVAVPMLKAVLTDAQGAEITSWLFSATASELDPGERASFETTVRDLPKEKTELSIAFSVEAPTASDGKTE